MITRRGGHGQVHLGVGTLGAAGIGAISAPRARRTSLFFRIGTGGTAGTYFPIGGLIANAISNPPGSRSCKDGGSCGVARPCGDPRVSSNGSVANVTGIRHRQHAVGLHPVGCRLLGGVPAPASMMAGQKNDGLRAHCQSLPRELSSRRAQGFPVSSSMADLKGKRGIAR